MTLKLEWQQEKASLLRIANPILYVTYKMEVGIVASVPPIKGRRVRKRLCHVCVGARGHYRKSIYLVRVALQRPKRRGIVDPEV